jgi:hypothetical protein
MEALSSATESWLEVAYFCKSRSDARLHGHAGVLPYGAYATRLGASPWVVAAGFTPELLMKANWRYVDAPGTAGASYGLQTQQTEILGGSFLLPRGPSSGTPLARGCERPDCVQPESSSGSVHYPAAADT